MKKINTRLVELSLVLSFFAYSSSAYSANLVSNGSFETGLTDWVDWGGSSSAVEGNAYAGSYALGVSTAEGGEAQNIASSLVPNGTYNFSAYGRLTNAADAYTAWVGIKFLSASGAVLLQTSLPITTTSYQLISFNFQAPQGFASADVLVWRTAGEGEIYVDDFSVTATTTAASPSASPSPSKSVAPSPSPTAVSASAITSTVIGKQSGLCLDIPGAATTSGLAIQQYTCNGTDAQSYTFTSVGSGAFTIKAGTGLCLESMGSETRVEQVTCSGAANQEWVPTVVSGDSYLFAAENGTGCLNVSGDSTSSGGEILTWACSSASPNEIFTLTRALATGSTTTTPAPSPSPSPSKTVAPSPSPSPAKTVAPSPSPSPSKTVAPSPSPSPAKTVAPSPSPSPIKTVAPSPSPSPTSTTTSTGKTYYISPTGSDSNNGTSSSAPWLSPNHSVNCGDTILAAAGNYNSTNFGPGQWGTVSCSAGNSVAWLKCETFDTCKFNVTSGAYAAVAIDESYWGVQGFEATVSTSVTYGTCFVAGASGYHTGNVHHVIFANNVANGCSQGGFGTSNLNSTASADYVVIVGNIAYNTAQGSTECTSGISIYQPVASDTKAGTHIFIAGNFAYANVDASNCGGTTATDGEAVILDTFNMAYGGGAPYTQQAVVENNIGFFNGGLGFEVNNNNTGSSHATVYFKNNTSYGNMTQTNQEYCSGRAEFMAQTSDNTTLENNIAQTRTGTSCSSDALYAFTTDSPNSTETVNSNWFYSAAGDNDLIVSSSGFSMGSANVLGSTPEFANPVNPGAPSCSGYPNVPACMAQVIADYTPKASGASGYGYQPVSGVNVPDTLYPQWLCNVNLPSGLVDPGCE